MAPEIYTFVIAAIITAVISTSLKKDNPAFAIFIVLVMSVIIFITLLPHITTVFDIINEIGSQIDTSSEYLLIVMKIIGIAYVAEFGSQICTDAGEVTLAASVNLAGKVLIMVISAPVITALLRQITGLY